MYVVIVGCGSVGVRLALRLSVHNHNVVVLDRDPRRFAQLGSAFNGLTVVGNGIDVESLRSCNIEKATGFAAVTSNDNVNIMAAQIAQKVFRVPRVVARVNDPDREHVYHEFGLPTVSAVDITAAHMESRLLAGVFVQSREINNQLVQVEFPVTDEWVGRRLVELERPGLMRIQAVMQGDVAKIPDDSYELVSGDHLIGVVPIARLPQVRHHIGLPRGSRK